MDALPFVLVFGVFGLFALVYARYRQACQGAPMPPLSNSDRIHISLATRHLEEAERELMQVAWVGYAPGHPLTGDLLLQVKDINTKARRALRDL
jgi:hypothetical protein